MPLTCLEEKIPICIAYVPPKCKFSSISLYTALFGSALCYCTVELLSSHRHLSFIHLLPVVCKTCLKIVKRINSIVYGEQNVEGGGGGNLCIQGTFNC